MINEIIDSIAIALFQEFGEEYSIYTDTVEQGLQEPCFFIADLTTNTDRYLGSRKNNLCSFDVHYFSKAKTQRDILDVSMRLLECLTLITSVDGNSFLGTDMHTEKEDGVLHCFVNYNFVTYESEKLDNAMSDVKIKQGVDNKNGRSKNEGKTSR